MGLTSPISSQPLARLNRLAFHRFNTPNNWENHENLTSLKTQAWQERKPCPLISVNYVIKGFDCVMLKAAIDISFVLRLSNWAIYKPIICFRIQVCICQVWYFGFYISGFIFRVCRIPILYSRFDISCFYISGVIVQVCRFQVLYSRF